MFDFMFFVKTMVLTVILVSLMQIKAGKTTIEDHATQWIRTSVLTQPLHSTATAGAKAISDSAKWLSASFQKQTRKIFGSRKSEMTNRSSALNFKRSASYEREQEAKENALDKAADEAESE